MRYLFICMCLKNADWSTHTSGQAVLAVTFNTEVGGSNPGEASFFLHVYTMVQVPLEALMFFNMLSVIFTSPPFFFCSVKLWEGICTISAVNISCISCE